MSFFNETMGEALGAIGLVLGAGTRLAALGIVAVMLGAIEHEARQPGQGQPISTDEQPMMR